MSLGVTQTRIQRLLDERVTAAKLHEGILAAGGSRRQEPDRRRAGDDQRLPAQSSRSTNGSSELNDVLKREESSAAVSRDVRAHLAGNGPGVETAVNGDEVPQFAVYARDQIIAKYPQVATQPAATPSGRPPANG